MSRTRNDCIDHWWLLLQSRKSNLTSLVRGRGLARAGDPGARLNCRGIAWFFKQFPGSALKEDGCCSNPWRQRQFVTARLPTRMSDRLSGNSSDDRLGSRKKHCRQASQRKSRVNSGSSIIGHGQINLFLLLAAGLRGQQSGSKTHARKWSTCLRIWKNTQR